MLIRSMSQTSTTVQTIMDAQEALACLRSMAREILGSVASLDELALIGIQTGGVHLARQLLSHIEATAGTSVAGGQLDVAMYRDDLHQRLAPAIHATAVPFDLAGRDVILVDDVLCSGRTTRAALDALTDLGRPRRVRLAVLVDRGLRELPIQADFVGKAVGTVADDQVDVRFNESGEVQDVVLGRSNTEPEPR